MIRVISSALLIVLILSGQVVAQEVPLDTIRIPSGDSVLIITPEMLQQRPQKADTLGFEKYIFYDSLTVRALPSRLDLRPDANRSFLHDAGDFLKFAPSYSVIEDHQTPQRKTAAPFSLPGERLNLILDGRPLAPSEHILQPDGLTDLNDIPDFASGGVYSVEGPLGMAFGAENAVSSLIMTLPRPERGKALSGLVVDKGSWGYANTRAQFTSESQKGRRIAAAVQYRKAKGAYLFLSDSAYHQWGEIYQPVGKRWSLNLQGWLYRRMGTLAIYPDTIFYPMTRDRREQQFQGAIEYYHSSAATSALEYGFRKSESRPSGSLTNYKRALKIFDNSLRLFHYHRFGTVDSRLEVIGGEEEFDDLGVNHKRWHTKAAVTLSTGDSSSNLTLYSSVAKVERFDPLPAAMLSYQRNRERSFIQISAGYAGKLPRQSLLYLTSQAEKLLDLNTFDYYEAGNPDLKPEKQLVGNLTVGLGRTNNDLVLSATGGKIFDGIDWLRRADTLTGPFYRPGTHDLEFISTSLVKTISYRDNIYWKGGGSYRYLTLTDNDNPPYAPEYQLFSGLELSYQFRKPPIRLYGYIEGQYYGPYHGFRGKELGQDPIINLKFSFSIKSFHFYYIFQNITGAAYALREDAVIPTWYDFFGFSWNFLD